MLQVELRRVLIRPRKRQQPCFAIKRGKKSETYRGSRSAVVSFDLTLLVFLRWRSVFTAEAVWQNQSGLAGEVGDYELLAVRGRHDYIEILKYLRDRFHGHRSGAIRLDVFHGWNESSRTKCCGPVVR